MTVQPSHTHHHEDHTSTQSEPLNAFNGDVAIITRSASSNQLGSLSTAEATALRRTWSENVLTGSRRSQDNAGQTPEARNGAKAKGKQTSYSAPRPQYAVSSFTLKPPVGTEEDGLELHGVQVDGKAKSMSRSFSRLARRSWYPAQDPHHRHPQH